MLKNQDLFMKKTHSFFAVTIILQLIFYASTALCVETGESPYIYGIHDWTPESVAFFESASSGSDCVRGWIMHAEAIGDSGSSGGADFTSLTSAGFGVIVRLDFSWDRGTLPPPDRFDEFAATFAEYVRNSRGGVHIWIVANEPNLKWAGVNFSPQDYADAYMMVRNAVHALPGHSNDQVLVAAPGIWADHPDLYGDWLYDYFEGILNSIGTSYDGFAIHAYTREFSPSAITSDLMWPDGTHNWHFHFRVYRDLLNVLRNHGITGVPLYITEAGNVCDPPCDPYPDADLGYFVAMYNEINSWNTAHPDQIIRAVTPYRWTLSDDGTGRDFCIGCSGGLRSDLANAIREGWKWTNSGCPGAVPSGCREDGDCPSDSLCNLDSGECEQARTCTNDSGCSPQLCHLQYHICVPKTRGEGRINFTPSPGVPGSILTIDAFHDTEGLTNVSLKLEGPEGNIPLNWVGVIDGSPPVFQWQWTAVPEKEGTYRATFMADPGNHIYAIGYVHVISNQNEEIINPEEPAETIEIIPENYLQENDPGVDTAIDSNIYPDASDGITEEANGLKDVEGGCSCYMAN